MVDEVCGHVAPGFGAIEAVFSQSDLGHGGAAFTAYVDGEQVADLWAGTARPGVPWAESTLATLMSATKGCAVICAQLLHDRGLLDVDARVVDYWPAYGQAGKQDTLVRHVLNHTAGMLCFEDPGAILDWAGNGWDDYDEIARRIALSQASWAPGAMVGYHGISVGWLIQELVRRVTGMTVGAFFAAEVARPLGLSIFIGTPADEQQRLADVLPESPRPMPPEIAVVEAELREVFRNPSSLLARAGVAMHGRTLTEDFTFFNLPKVRSAEIPAANASGDARSLARMYAVLAQDGELDGVRLLTPQSVSLFRRMTISGPSAGWPRDLLPDSVPLPHLRYALGYEGDFGLAPKPWRFGPTPATFGHLGAGGQIGFADPVRKVSVGFVRSHLADWEVSNALVEALYASLDQGR